MKRLRLAQFAAVILLVGYWSAETLGSQYAIALPGVLDDLWYSAAPLVLGWVLALAVGLYVARWWVLLAAITPILVLGGLELAGHRHPWQDAGPPLTQYGWHPVLWILFWVNVLPLMLGVSIRRGLGERGVGSPQYS